MSGKPRNVHNTKQLFDHVGAKLDCPQPLLNLRSHTHADALDHDAVQGLHREDHNVEIKLLILYVERSAEGGDDSRQYGTGDLSNVIGKRWIQSPENGTMGKGRQALDFDAGTYECVLFRCRWHVSMHSLSREIHNVPHENIHAGLGTVLH